MRISILIVNFNGLKHLKDCFESIFVQEFKDFEIVMVDNASHDGSVAFVQHQFPEVRIVLSETNLGFAGGNNLGILHCRGEFVFLLNNDTRLDSKALMSLSTELDTYPKNRVFACFLLDYHRPHLVDSAGDTLYSAGVPFSFSGFAASKFTEPRSVTAACAGAAVYSKLILELLGGFDENFFLVFEDVDLSLRARHFGEEILFLPSVKVYHKGSASMGGKRSPLYFYYSERNLLPVLIKTFPLPILVLTMPRYLFLKALRMIHAIKLGCLGPYFRANFDSLKMIANALKHRKKILGSSRIPKGEFKKLLRKNWLMERISMSRGRYALPLK